jgi:hypothetical protein
MEGLEQLHFLLVVVCLTYDVFIGSASTEA